MCKLCESEKRYAAAKKLYRECTGPADELERLEKLLDIAYDDQTDVVYVAVQDQHSNNFLVVDHKTEKTVLSKHTTWNEAEIAAERVRGGCDKWISDYIVPTQKAREKKS
jgi:hypothetical protein